MGKSEKEAKNTREMRIYEQKDQIDEFWIKMGPFFASKTIRRELPYIMNQPGQTWFVMFENQAVIGFVSGLERKDVWYLDNIFVLPEYRHQNLMPELIQQFMKYCEERDATKKVKLETQNPTVREYFLKQQYQMYKQTKTWVFLEGPLIK